jgi:hypothetical protein
MHILLQKFLNIFTHHEHETYVLIQWTLSLYPVYNYKASKIFIYLLYEL